MLYSGLTEHPLKSVQLSAWMPPPPLPSPLLPSPPLPSPPLPSSPPPPAPILPTCIIPGERRVSNFYATLVVNLTLVCISCD